MNILRNKRKGKLKNGSTRLLAIALAFIMTTFAWVAYVNMIENDSHFHLNSWNIKYYLGTGEDKEEISNPVTINFTDELYPQMPNKTKMITVENNGEVYVELSYVFSGITILGQEYEILSVDDTITSYPEHYVISDEKIIGNNLITQVLIRPTDITNLTSTTPDDYKIPIQLTIKCPRIVSYMSYDVIKVTLSWEGNNDELDTYWGNLVSQYKENHPNSDKYISFNLNIKATQIITDKMEIVTSENYGEYIDLDTNLLSKVNQLSDNTYPKEDWRILYKDDDYVYAILADYLPTYGNSDVINILEECELTGGSTNNIYQVSAESTEKLNDGLENSNWNGLILDIFIPKGFSVVGAEDIEFWNNVNENSPVVEAKIIERIADNDSLQNILVKNNNIKNQVLKTGENITNLSTSNSNFIPHNEIFKLCEGYWMEYSDSSSNSQYVKYDGNIMTDSTVKSNIGVRPIVRIPLTADVIVNESEGENVWKIVAPSNEDSDGNTLYSQISSDNYGDYVNLGTNLGLTDEELSDGSNPIEDWRILYKDTTEEKVYLIASEYLNNNYNDLVSAGLEEDENYGWYSNVSASDLLDRLTNEDNWKKLLNGTKFQKDSDVKVYGTVDIEKIVASLNEVYDDKLWTAKTSNLLNNLNYYGFYIGSGTTVPDNYESSRDYYSYINTEYWDILENNTLYWPYSITWDLEDENYGEGYWFSNISADSSSEVMGMYGGGIGFDNYNCPDMAIRPIVVLPNDIIANAQIEDGKIIWNTNYEVDVDEDDDDDGTLYEQVKIANYGDYVDLGTNLNLTSKLLSDNTYPKEDWRILYKDTNEKKIYLIASEFLNNSYNETLSTELETDEDYGWYSNTSASDLLNKLLDTSKWEGLLTGTSIQNEENVDVYGTVDLKKYISSLNDTYDEQKLWTEKTESYMEGSGYYGYYIGLGNTAPASYSNSNEYYYYLGMNQEQTAYTSYWEKVKNNTLYWPYSITWDLESENCGEGYWFSNASAYSKDDVMAMYEASIAYESYNIPDMAIRPIVVLPSNILASSTTEDGITIWKIPEMANDVDDEEDDDDPVLPSTRAIKLAVNANPQQIMLATSSKGIYTRFDGEENGIFTMSELLKNIIIPDGWEGMIIGKNDEEISYTKNEIEENAKNISLENVISITICYSDEKLNYSLYQAGNVYIGDSREYALNINDVIWLRKALIEDEKILESEYYVARNANTNLLDGENAKADISDVIAIRYKILTGEWKKTEESE